MRRLLFSQITREDLTQLVKVENLGIRDEPWGELSQGELTDSEQRIVDWVTEGLKRFQPSVVNEATIWGRAIFPLLTLAEATGVEVQADVALSALIGDVELSGSADGAFGTPCDGEIIAPFLIVVEAKRGVEGHSPVAQLHAEMLAAAHLNARETGKNEQRIHGAYTVGSNWTFVCADVGGIDTPRPSFRVVSSQEYSEKADSAVIVKILKSIVAQRSR